MHAAIFQTACIKQRLALRIRTTTIRAWQGLNHVANHLTNRMASAVIARLDINRRVSRAVAVDDGRRLDDHTRGRLIAALWLAGATEQPTGLRFTGEQHNGQRRNKQLLHHQYSILVLGYASSGYRSPQFSMPAGLSPVRFTTRHQVH